MRRRKKLTQGFRTIDPLRGYIWQERKPLQKAKGSCSQYKGYRLDKDTQELKRELKRELKSELKRELKSELKRELKREL